MSATLETIGDLKQRFPLFEYKMVDANYIQVTLQGGVTVYVHSELTGDDLITLTREHNNKKRKLDYEKKYPNLYFSSDCHTIWVKRNGRDADGIPHKYPLTEDEMNHWNKVAGQALQSGYFLCFICGKAKPRSEYGYYHFCAEYCKDCLKSHPDVERSARNENYE